MKGFFTASQQSICSTWSDDEPRVLLSLRQNVRRKRSQPWQSSGRFHRNNALALAALSVCSYLISQRRTLVPHSPFLSDLVPCHFLLFPWINKNLKGKRFDIEAVKTGLQEALDGITVEEFQECFKRLRKKFDKCIEVEGQYFEGDYIDFVLKMLINNNKPRYFWVPL